MNENRYLRNNLVGEDRFAIDFGSSFSKAAFASKLDAPQVIQIAHETPSLVPSVIYVPDSGPCQIGDGAERQALLHPEGIVRNLKSSIHRTDKLFRNRRFFSPCELTSELIKFFKTETERLYRFDRAGEQCVIVTGACNTIQENRCLDMAAKAAGYEEVELIESSLAGFRHWMNGRAEADCPKAVAVVDLGAAATEFSVVERIPEGCLLAPWFAAYRESGVSKIDGMIWERLMNAEDANDIPLNGIPGIRTQLRQAKEAFSRTERPTESLKTNSENIQVPRRVVEECFDEFFEEVFAGVDGIGKQLAKRGLEEGAMMLLMGGGAEIQGIESHVRKAGWKGSVEIANQPQFAAVLGACLEDRFATKICPETGSLQPKSARECPCCGYPFWKFENKKAVRNNVEPD